jgi:hypothetical protein
MRKIIETCPTCGGHGLAVSEVTCDTCGTQVRSRYSPCPFCGLSEEQQTFLLLFVRSRGNLKDVEKTLGVSYPTVRAKLDEIIDRLTPPALPAPASERRAVLDLVQSGQLGVSEALAMLRGPAGSSDPTE